MHLKMSAKRRPFVKEDMSELTRYPIPHYVVLIDDILDEIGHFKTAPPS